MQGKSCLSVLSTPNSPTKPMSGQDSTIHRTIEGCQQCLCAGLMALQSLNVGANCIKHELDIRILAALPALHHLALAGNPVVVDMDPREQRVLIMDMMPGKHSRKHKQVGHVKCACVCACMQPSVG